MKKILFVCLGNICRSPMAEAIFKEKIEERGLAAKYDGDSAGTAAYHIGETPDPRTLSTLASHGIFFTHRGQQFDEDLNRQFDYIIAMDSTNKQNIERLIGRADKLYLMRDFDAIARGADVPDPYYGGEDGFEKVYQMIDRSISSLIDFLENK